MKEAESLDKRYPKLSAAVLDLARVINHSFTTNISLFTSPRSRLLTLTLI